MRLNLLEYYLQYLHLSLYVTWTTTMIKMYYGKNVYPHEENTIKTLDVQPW